MKTQRISFFLAAVLLTFGAATSVRAQFNETNSLFYHAQRAPQTNLLNPALHPGRNTFYLSFPGIDNIQFGSPLSLNEIIYFDPVAQVSVINLDSIFHRLTDDNQFRFGSSVNILGLGLKIKNLFVNTNLRLVNQVNVGLPISTVNAFLNGNMDQEGNVINEVEFLSGDLFNAQSYLETSIGAGYHISPINLTVGIHAKLLSGLANIQTDNTRVVLETDDEVSSLSAHMYYELRAASAIPYDYDTVNGVEFKFPKTASDIFKGFLTNTGLAFDIGARWDLGLFSFSLALNDLSAGIHWKNNLFAISPKYGQGVIEFNGIDINNFLDNGTFSADSFKTYLQERIENMTPATDTAAADYWYPIPTKINLGANVTLLKYLRAGLLFHGQFDRGIFCKSGSPSLDDITVNVTNTFRWNTTISFSASLFDWAELIVGSSIVHDGTSFDFFNPGAGIILAPAKAFQLYLMADYISNIRLVQAKAFNIKCGANLLFGKGGKKKATPFLPDLPISL